MRVSWLHVSGEQHEARRVVWQLVAEVLHVVVNVVVGAGDFQRLFVDLVFFEGRGGRSVGVVRCRLHLSFVVVFLSLLFYFFKGLGLVVPLTYDCLRVFRTRSAQTELAQRIFGGLREGVEA
jgi:hypothetical protein